MTDPGIILFGKKIGLPPNPPPYTTAEDQGDDPKTPSIDEESMSENPQSTDGETMNLQPKTLKKPDKILPCPRCDSMNTKFCYFNNSNVNQPRHFCKSCQRYWTAGGTMRNMPVGAGRRKKKTPPSSHYRYIISQEALDSASSVNQIEFAPDSNRIQPKVLSFGQNPVQIEPGSSGKENKEVSQSQVQWIPTGSCPWPYNPWNTQVPFSVPVPVPMYPSPYWTSVSWLPQSGSILGKHSIEVESELVKSNPEESKKQRNTILTPKTLRIDDPDEAAKSSIWATLGIKNERMSSRGEIFKAFQSKGNEKTKTAAPEPESCPVLHANPAAFSRSVCFQERA